MLGVITLNLVVSIHLWSPTIFSHQPGSEFVRVEVTCEEEESDGIINTTGPCSGPISSLKSELLNNMVFEANWETYQEMST